MQRPPIAEDEDARLKALYAMRLLDTPAEARFDWLVQYAARELRMPMALISLVDGHRQWFKARVGLEVSETPCDVAFCAHAIASDEIFIVEDATQDERFADNPLVTGAPHIRFYAGAPLKAPDGHRIGTICVLDTRPRRLAPAELSILDALRAVFNADVRMKPGRLRGQVQR